MNAPTSWQEWAAIAQIVVLVFTAVGVITSLYFSMRALREVQADRRLRQKPHLMFERGGYHCPVVFVKNGRYVPGVNPNRAQELLKHIPEDAESVRLLEKKREDGSIDAVTIGRLKNYGQGPALETVVTWIAKEIWFGNDHFHLDDDKLSEPIYGYGLNSMPAVPSHILPGEEAGLPRLPTFIDKDVDKKISRVDGVLLIQGKDVFDETHALMQQFSIFTDYKDAKPHVIVTFAELVPGNSDAV